MVGDLFSDPGFMPHIHCYLGKNSLVWTMFFTDLLIGLAYVSISLMLWALVRKIRIEFSLVILCFGLFIGACGATHFLDVWTLWHPNYWVAATVKIVTALASVGTGFYLYRLRHLIVKTALAGKRLEIERNQKIVLAEQDLRDVLERTTDGFFQINSEWKVTFVNPVTQKFVAPNGKEILGLPLAEVFHSREQPKFMAHFESILATGDPEQFEEVYGGRILAVHAYRTRDLGLAVFYRDVTDEREAQKKISESEIRFRTLTEALPQLVWTCRSNGQCDYLSHQWIDYTGIPLTEQLGFNWLSRVVHPDDQEKTLTHWMGAVAGKHPYDIEYRIRRYDGVYRWFKTRGAPLRDAGGAILQWFGTCTDIEDQKETQFALRESQARFESIVNTIPQLAWTARPDGFIYWYNENWYRYTGTTPQDTEGWGWQKVHHPETLPRVLEKWRASIANGHFFDMEFPIRGADGSFRWFLTRVTPLKDEQGQVLQWFGTNTDISEQRSARDELARASQAKDELLSICSHELRTPVASMKLSNQMVLRGFEKNDLKVTAPDRILRMVKQADRQLDRLTRLIEEMLDFSRIANNRLSFNYEKIELNAWLLEIVERLRVPLESVGCSLSVKLSEPIDCEWDPFRMEQVLDNLISNAMKYGAGKPVTLAIVESGDIVTISVKDEGLGVAEVDQERIFRPYERAVSVNHISGLGLGLYISEQIVRVHGGKIEVQSELGQGSVFTVLVPKHAVGATSLKESSV